MTKTNIRQLLIPFVLACLMSGTDTGFARLEAETHNVTVSIQDVSCEQGKLAFDWAITNSEKLPVYIYATFLKGDAVGLDFDKSSHLLTVWTSRRSEANFAVNAYPRAQFIKLEPGEVLRGHFADSPRATPPVIGAIQLAFAVAFGQSTESVKTALRQGNYVHPANPIVRWQKIGALTQLHPHQTDDG